MPSRRLNLAWKIRRDLTEEDLEMHIDLRPYMQRVPFLVHANASLSRAYRLFRTMGLHTLYVGQAKPLVMGVITRKVSMILAFLRVPSASTKGAERASD